MIIRSFFKIFIPIYALIIRLTTLYEFNNEEIHILLLKKLIVLLFAYCSM